MTDTSKTTDGLSVLTLGFEVVDRGPDWPVLAVTVNGSNPFAKVAKNWRGFDPDDILGADAPLAPQNVGRRVAIYRCSCGQAGCGVIAPAVVVSSDRSRVSWVDFRNYVGLFDGPVAPIGDEHEGGPWDLPDLHFDRNQYLSEVRRVTNDRSWETPRRQKARLLDQRLTPIKPVLPPTYALRWISPAWDEDGLILSFETPDCPTSQDDQPHHHQQLLRLDSRESDPSRAADDMAGQLLSTPPTDWLRIFGYDAH